MPVELSKLIIDSVNLKKYAKVVSLIEKHCRYYKCFSFVGKVFSRLENL